MQNIDINEYVSAVDNGENCEATKEEKNNKQTFGGGATVAADSARLEEQRKSLWRTNVTSATYLYIYRLCGYPVRRCEEGARTGVAVTISRIITTHEHNIRRSLRVMLVDCLPFRVFFMHVQVRGRHTNLADSTFSIMGCAVNNSILKLKLH